MCQRCRSTTLPSQARYPLIPTGWHAFEGPAERKACSRVLLGIELSQEGVEEEEERGRPLL
eukprot:7334475-Pyramimonas_sp.AAC.1